MGLTATVVAWELKSKLVSGHNPSHPSIPLVITPLVASITPIGTELLDVTHPCYHTTCKLAEVCQRSLAIIYTVSASPL